MDRLTIAAYDAGAENFAHDWHSQAAPADLYDLIRRFFSKGATADVGCGSGRAVAWLNDHGYRATGFDASRGLLVAARRRYPDAEFRFAVLPDLEGIAAASFDNVLCETVIMHLPHADIAAAAQRLIEIVKPGGVLCLSWRVSKGSDQRDKSGRLYSAFESGLVRFALAKTQVLLDEDVASASSGRAIHRIIVRK